MSRNCFVAWPVTNGAEWLAALESAAPSGLRFLHPDDLHVTLTFLGAHDPKQEQKISALLRGLPLTGTDITTAPLIALPQPRRFSAIVAGIDLGRAELDKQIAKWLPRISREAGAHIDTRAPLPHITIARPERRITDDERDAILEWLDQPTTAPSTPLTLAAPAYYRWDIDDSPRRYSFAGPAPE